MKESNFTAITPRPKTPDFIKSTFKSLRKKIVPAKKPLSELRKIPIIKREPQQIAQDLRRLLSQPPIPKKRNRNQRDYFFLAFFGKFYYRL